MSKALNYIALVVGFLTGLYALFLSFAGSPNYELIFIRILICDAVACAVVIFLLKRRLFLPGVIALIAIIIYTLLDVTLRYFAHTRISELF